ncbi:MAG: hypothetical protein R3Y04_05645 [Rikenellaceae bacterium]
MKKTYLTALFSASLLLSSCCGTCSSSDQKEGDSTTKNIETMEKFQKKYTNADYYTDGKFNEDVAIQAMKELLAFHGIPFTKFMEENFWVAEFGLGDFENCGMGGIFWVNDQEHSYFGHAIYLLPGQMIPEHAHMKTEFAPKYESWLVDKGWCYNFSEVGEATPNAPAIPESQAATTRSKNWIRMNVGDVAHLKEAETFHFLYAGDEGAIVTEFACYHDGAGLRFSNPKAKM